METGFYYIINYVSRICVIGQLILFVERHLLLFPPKNTILKIQFNYFQRLVFETHKSNRKYIKKSVLEYFYQWPKPTCFSHRLRQWEIENEERSLAQVRYAVKPKNPE